MAFFCGVCLVNWWPYQTVRGACPVCGGGTRFRQERGDPGADVLALLARIERESRARRAAFEAYYSARMSAAPMEG